MAKRERGHPAIFLSFGEGWPPRVGGGRREDVSTEEGGRADELLKRALLLGVEGHSTKKGNRLGREDYVQETR